MIEWNSFSELKIEFKRENEHKEDQRCRIYYRVMEVHAYVTEELYESDSENEDESDSENESELDQDDDEDM